MFDFDYKSSDPTIWLNNGKRFRKLVGINGMLLPFLLWLFVWIASGQKEVLDSISHYYFTRGNTIFIGIMSAISIFLIVYKGEEKQDFIVSLVSGVAAICVILFPTDNLGDCTCCVEPCGHIIAHVNDDGFRENFHYISAAIFLLGLAYMSGVLFVKSDKPKEERGRRKIIRNRIYRICAVVMVLAMGVIFFLGFLGWWISEDLYNELNLTFWMEALAVESFGVSWLVKGEAIFGD